MANDSEKYLFLLLCAVFCFAVNAQEGPADAVECEDVCQTTYSPHTFPNGEQLESCLRGCRLFGIIDVLEGSDLNNTRNSCIFTCSNAYSDEKKLDACKLGCSNKQPFMPQLSDIDMNFFRSPMLDMSFMTPLMYVRDLYSNVVNKMGPSVYSTSWSFYMDNTGNGKMVIVRSGPQMKEDIMTANYVETNLQPLDNSATPNVKNSQIPGSRWGNLFEEDTDGLDAPNYGLFERDLDDDPEQQQSSGWLSCFGRQAAKQHKLMISALMISMFGLLLLFTCHLCSNPADKKRTMNAQKLSIYGDADFLQTLDQKKYLRVTSPQQPLIEAPPLPIKLKVGEV